MPSTGTLLLYTGKIRYAPSFPRKTIRYRMSDKMEDDTPERKDAVYHPQDPEYLHFTRSLIECAHTDLPNPYYKHQAIERKERNDYANSTENIIRALVNQYGPFNQITEEMLQGKIDGVVEDEKDIRNSEVDKPTTEDDLMGLDSGERALQMESEKVTEEEVDEREVKFYQTRDEMLRYVQQALGSSTMTLDFVSLLLSSVRPAAGSSSLSPQVKQSIKLGSLSCSTITIDPNTEELQEKKEVMESMKVGRGWKLQSLKKASSLVTGVVSNLKKDLEDENTYWNEVVDVLEQKELITAAVAPTKNAIAQSKANGKQTPSSSSRKVLAVKYGYGDSGSDYFDNGMAVLEKGKDGHLSFQKLSQNEREKIWSGEKIVRVKIYKLKRNLAGSLSENELIGQSDAYGTLQKDIIQDDDSFIAKVRNSRFFIFENELFWHLMKEAASLISFQVKVIDTTISIELLGRLIQIDAVDIHSEELATLTPELPENEKADEMIQLFRILLCANNYKNMEKLKVPPVALSKDVSPRSKPGVIIRPLIMYSKHNYLIGKFKEILLNVLLELGEDEVSAKKIIADQMSVKKYVNDPNSLPKFQNSKRCYNNDAFLRVYSKLAPVSLVILKYNKIKLWIELASSYSTLHITMQVKVVRLDNKQTILESTYHSKRDVAACLSWVLKHNQ